MKAASQRERVKWFKTVLIVALVGKAVVEALTEGELYIFNPSKLSKNLCSIGLRALIRPLLIRVKVRCYSTGRSEGSICCDKGSRARFLLLTAHRSNSCDSERL
jgi:hypothetical protein